MSAVVEAALRHMLEYNEYRREGWRVWLRVRDVEDRDETEITLWRALEGRYARGVDVRAVSTTITGESVWVATHRSPDQLVGFLRRELNGLFARLFPAPLPVFRIGLRAPKRLQPRPERKQ